MRLETEPWAGGAGRIPWKNGRGWHGSGSREFNQLDSNAGSALQYCVTPNKFLRLSVPLFSPHGGDGKSISSKGWAWMQRERTQVVSLLPCRDSQALS